MVNDYGRGVYPAMNLGISAANFSHILFLNTGDLITSEVQLLDCLIEINKNIDISLILPVSANWSLEIENSTPDLLQFILGVSGNYVSHQGVLFAKTFLQQAGLLDPRFKVAADFKQLCLLLKNGSYKKLGAKLVLIEYPKFSSKFNRRGRLETFFIIFKHVPSVYKLKALKSRFINECKSLLQKFS